ncbi:Gfo/Idh/MocA family oxidoreductase [Candidatus Poribacteria bacterium]|nr:Gfo/Idh/MocA family oxidoreductase [Candidatus Poribacteria bacterium]
MSKHYRACLIGCGRMGATIDDEVKDGLPFSHAAGYTAVENVYLVAVSDVIPEKVENIQKRYNVPRGYTDYREMLQKEQPDIVSIATRPATHAEMTIFAAENGVKGIYCEKPLCCSMEEADAMVAACETNSVKFNYGTNRRYQPLYWKMRELIASGEIGELQCVICHCGVSAAQWMHTHTSDMMMYLAGDAEIEFVQGAITANASDWEGNRLNTDPGIPMGYVKFRNGVLGYQLAAGGYEFEVSGSKGKLRAFDNGSTLQCRMSGKQPYLIAGIQPDRGTVNCIKDLIQAISTGGETRGNIQLARRSQEMILGFVESHRQGGKRVTLPLENRSLYVGRRDW